MDNVVETVSETLSLILLFLIPFFLFTVYLIKRNGFYVNANCWFCNTWTKVLYTDRNSFCCPSCLQYNGFDEDGGYNKILEAQYDITSVNKINKTIKKTVPAANGLCTYCNKNQQLKVYQLANFVPLNENNYDKEVEHFDWKRRINCVKKCDNVLKTTIEKQHAWLFGNRLKKIHNKAYSFLSQNQILQKTKIAKYSSCLNLLKYLLILSSVLIICQTLEVRMNYPADEITPLIPKFFIPTLPVLNDIAGVTSKVSIIISDAISHINLYLPKQIKLHYNNLLPITCSGLLLQLIYLIWDQRTSWWKVNEILGWTLLVVTTLISFDGNHSAYIKLLQAFCATIIICSLVSTSKHLRPRKTTKKKFEFKKLSRCAENTDYSDIDEDVTEISDSVSLFQSKVQSNANTKNIFTSARSIKNSSILSGSVKSNSDLNSSSELNRSLDNLHLGSLNAKPPTCISPVFSVSAVNRPILSPPKLKNVTQNSWTAGGFWKNDGSNARHNFESSFGNLSLKSFNTTNNRVKSPHVFGKQTVVGSLFNNLPGRVECYSVSVLFSVDNFLYF
ncbi:hypothetical protein NQ318_018002 [Aromia moschata]|uniref:Ima1 N-terminal domain-containing protein n=1 Tax=Aromia moschata TaxID=1265417 RepID=A0AAV8Y8L5_9CUCU|nr:hypothetical protein NQ318_018002 [Aromia moschata]